MRFTLLFLTLIACVSVAIASENPLSHPQLIPGPIPSALVRVTDGDTIVVRAKIWLRQDVETSVRLRGIDAPEMKGACPKELVLAEKARDRVVALLNAASSIALYDIAPDKYGGRVLASLRLTMPNHERFDLSQRLLDEGLVRSYEGGRRLPWCP